MSNNNLKRWAVPTWLFLHTFAEKVNEKFYLRHIVPCLSMIKAICSHLPCPDCRTHATAYMEHLTPWHIRTRSHLQRALFYFHNYVNRRLGKPEFNISQLRNYKQHRLAFILPLFVKGFTHRFSIGLVPGRGVTLSDRKIVARRLTTWLQKHWGAFQH